MATAEFPISSWAVETYGVEKRFGGVLALGGVDLRVETGRIHALIGPNGSGKTTLLSVIAGSLKADRGTVFLKGKNVTGLAAWKRARLGLGRAFQTPALFESMTLADSLSVATAAGKSTIAKLDDSARARALARIGWSIDQVGSLAKLDTPVNALSHGDRKRAEVALALAAGGDFIILDEPTAGMSEAETDHMKSLIVSLSNDWSVTSLVVEHDMDVVFGIADTITVLHQGGVIKGGTPDAIRADGRVQEVYLGGV